MGSAPVVLDDLHKEDADLEAAGRRADGYQPLAPDAVRIFLSLSANLSRYKLISYI